MATINFLFRSTKEEAPLTLRLLFRHNNKDFVFGASTKIKVTKEYWSKQHSNKRLKDSEAIAQRNEVNEKIGKIEEFILKAFDNTDINFVDKKWLEKRKEIFYLLKL